MQNTERSARFYNVNDVMKLLGVKQAKAYKIIRQLNKELSQKGYLTINGRVSAKFFDEKNYC